MARTIPTWPTVLVCGGRDYADAKRVRKVFNGLAKEFVGVGRPYVAIVQGGATGADALARKEALARGWPLVTIDAQWDWYGNSAGPLRNQWMVELLRPRLVVSFPGDRGTTSMIKIARGYGIEVRQIEP